MFNVQKKNIKGKSRTKKVGDKQKKLDKIAWKQPGNTGRGK